MRLNPAMGGKVHQDRDGQQDEGDRQRAHDPLKFDPALEHQVVENTEDEHEHGGLGEKCRAAPGHNCNEVEVHSRLSGHGTRQREMDGAGRIGDDRSGACCGASKSIVKHKTPYLRLTSVCSHGCPCAKSISYKLLILHILMHKYSA